jgi:hypothetical protein
MTEDEASAIVTSHNDEDGETIIVSHPEAGPGVTGPGVTVTGFRVSLDGPVMRFLMNGHP